MKKTKILTVVLCLILALASVGFVACSDNGTHTEHTYETTWTYNATEHWHKCTKDGCTSVSDKAPHNFVNGVCECGAKEGVKATPSEMLISFANSIAKIENSKGYNVLAKGVTGSVRGTEYEYKNGSERVSIPVEATFTADAEIFAGKDAEGNFEAKGNVSLAITLNKNTTEEIFKDVKDVVTVMTAKAAFAVKGEYIYAQYEMKDSQEGLPEGCTSTNDEMSGDVKMSFDELIAMIGGLISSDGSVPTVMVTVIRILPQVADKLAAYVKPIAEKAYVLSKSFLDEYLKKAMAINYSFTETEDGYVITTDLEKAKTVINDMCDMTMGDFIDKYVGENAVEKVAAVVKKLADMKIKDIITFAEMSLGLDLNEAEKLVNEIIAIVAPAEEGTPIPTLGTLLGYADATKEDGTPYTLKDFVLEIVQDKTVGELIEEYAPIEEGKTVNDYIDMAVKFLNEKTFIDAIGIITKQDLSQMKEQIRETAIGFATIADKTVKFELKIGKDGSFKSFDLNVTVNDEIVNEIVTILKNLGATIDKTENDGLNVSAKLSVYIGEFKNELKFDYDKLISDLDVKYSAEAENKAA